MIFNSLKGKCEYYRSREDHRLLPNGHILMMLDGRSFSKLIKNNFEKPFDNVFIGMMNETAQYLCENISGVKFAYVQSDEISLYIKDTDKSDPFFGLRSCKLLSVAASLTTAKFNQLFTHYQLINEINDKNIQDVVSVLDKFENLKLAQFDCKVWNVPTENDVYAWFLYRQLDCIRNSKAQTAQAYLPHSKLKGLTADEQIEFLKQEINVDWNKFPADKKFGRVITKETYEARPTKEVIEKHPEQKDNVSIRTRWVVSEMSELTSDEAKQWLFKLINGENV